MSNPESPARPLIATDYQIGMLHDAFVAALPEHGMSRLGGSAFEPNSHFAQISGRRLRVVAPIAAAALQVGKSLAIEYYPAMFDSEGEVPPHIDYVVTRARRSEVGSETLTVARAHDARDGFEVSRVLVPRHCFDPMLSDEQFEDMYESGQRFQDEIGYNTLTTIEVDALAMVANRLRALTRPGPGYLFGQIGLAWGATQGYYGLGKDRPELE